MNLAGFPLSNAWLGGRWGIRPGSFINRQQRTADHWKNASLEIGTLEKFKLFGT
jgi:hypothetical protein